MTDTETQTTNWNLMNTAPHDGTSLLVFDNHSVDKTIDGNGIVVARFDARHGWVKHQRNNYIITLVNPTHWMNLPEKPHD